MTFVSILKYFQLFCEQPSIEFMHDLLKCYGLNGFDDTVEFSKGDLIENNTVDKIENLLLEIVMYYLPCKAKIYLNDLNAIKKCGHKQKKNAFLAKQGQGQGKPP